MWEAGVTDLRADAAVGALGAALPRRHRPLHAEDELRALAFTDP